MARGSSVGPGGGGGGSDRGQKGPVQATSNQGPAPTPGLQAVPAKTTNDHDMYPHPVQCGLGTVPTTHRLGGQGTLGLQFV